MFDKMKQLMEMKRQADQIKKDLEASTLDVSEVSGINIVIDGAQSFRSIEVDAHLLTPDNKVRLENDLKRSINAAIKQSQNVAAKKMASLMPGM